MTITEEQKTKIITLSDQGYNNWQIAKECEMKYSTLCYWKRKLREKGISIKATLGRPKAGSLKSIKLLGKISDQTDY